MSKKSDQKILLVINKFLDYNCTLSDKELSFMLNIPKSSVGRYLTSERTKELIGIDNYAYIKKCRKDNKKLGNIKGGKNHG
jgi:DNA-binding transcriptional regulator LsrR (DeoR family)